jgi:hypothetical protein
MNKFLLCAALAAMVLLAAGRPGHLQEKSSAQNGQAQEKNPTQEKGPAQGQAFRRLFNGKDLSGWKHVGPGSMTVEDGLIQTHGGM